MVLLAVSGEHYLERKMAIEPVNESVKNASMGVDPSISPAPGLDPNGPEAQAAINAIQRSRTTTWGDVGRTALMGAGLGAGVQATNPLSAFLQGTLAGLQAPLAIAKQKQDQLKSTIDATPFGLVVPEAQNPDSPYHAFSGLPYGLVAPAVAGIALESVKISKQGEEARKTEQYKAQMEKVAPKIDYKTERDMALDFNKLPEVSEYKGVRSAYNQMTTAPLKIRDPKTGEIKPNGGGQMAFMSGYVKMMFPQARQNEGTLSLAEVSSIADQKTTDLYAKVFNGEFIQDPEINKLLAAARAKYRSSVKQYRPIADLWADSAENQNLNSTFVLSGDTGSGESLDDVFKALKAQNPGMTDNEVFAIMKSQGY